MSDAHKDELNTRLSVTETKVTNIEENMGEQKAVLKDIAVKVDGVRDRFSKMNGTLPHIQDTCNNIEKQLTNLIIFSGKQETKIEKNSLNIKLMWALIVPVAVAVTVAIIKVAFFAN